MPEINKPTGPNKSIKSGGFCQNWIRRACTLIRDIRVHCFIFFKQILQIQGSILVWVFWSQKLSWSKNFHESTCSIFMQTRNLVILLLGNNALLYGKATSGEQNWYIKEGEQFIIWQILTKSGSSWRENYLVYIR